MAISVLDARDAFAPQQLRVPAVALMGSSMGREQIALLRGHCPALKAVTLLLDGDEAGREAAETIAPRLCPHWWTRIAALPEGAQPDTVEPATLEQLLERKSRQS